MDSASSSKGLRSGSPLPSLVSGESRQAGAVVSVLLISAFGPLVVPALGLRLEHLVIYPLLALAALRVMLGKPLGMPTTLWSILYLWGGATVWMLAVTLTSEHAESPLAAVAGLENLVQPLALMVVLGGLFSRLKVGDLQEILEKAGQWTVMLLSLNAVLSIASIYVDTWPLMSWFIRVDPSGSSVWSRAASMGRNLGVFNQPMEAGIAYTVGLVTWVHLVIERRRFGWWLWGGAALLVTGGLLSVSKVFVLGGLPLAIAYVFWCAGVRLPGRLVRALLAAGGSTALLLSLGGWAGWDYLGRLFDRQLLSISGWVQLYTGGRFGSQGSGVQRLFEEAWNEVWLSGFGLGATSLLDNGFIEFFYQGGVVALILYICILLIIGLTALRAVLKNRPGAKLVSVTWVTVVGASIGAPVLTINRASIILWVLLVAGMSLALRSDERAMLPSEASGGGFV